MKSPLSFSLAISSSRNPFPGIILPPSAMKMSSIGISPRGGDMEPRSVKS